jgi:hypothetical protein
MGRGHSYFLLGQQPLASLLALFVSGARSIAGLPSKNPSGFKVKPVISQLWTTRSNKGISSKDSLTREQNKDK